MIHTGRQLFVHHPQIVSYLRKQTAQWFCNQDDIIQLSEGAKTEFYSKVEALAARHLSTTLGALAAGLPLYNCEVLRSMLPIVLITRSLQFDGKSLKVSEIKDLTKVGFRSQTAAHALAAG